MIWVVAIALIVSLSFNFLFAVLVSRRSAESALMLDRSHARTTKYTENLLDRLMAQEWHAYQQYQEQLAVPQEVEQEPEREMVTVRGPDRGGFGSRLGLTAYRPPEEEIEAMNEEIP
jgi:hypothetical protein